MHIAIDVREALRPRKTGKGVWVRGLVEALRTREIDLTFITDTPVPNEWHTAKHRELVVPGTGLLWHLHVATALRRIPDLHCYVSTVSYLVPAIAGKRVACATVVHDLIAFRREPHERRARWIERLTLGLALRRSTHILAISESTKRDLLARYPSIDSKNVTAIFAGPFREHPPLNEPHGQFILCAATLCPRKNQKQLIEGYASLPSSLKTFQLILIGSRGWRDGEIVDLARKTPGVVWKQYVPDAEYEHLLSTCTVFALPSLYEGFGMQILDALSRGIPILTSDRGSLKEVADGAALIVDPGSTASIAAGLERLLADADLQMELREKGPKQAKKYTWDRTADLLLQALRH
ncbi:glycosyltransferase family 4 protein [Candidatus Peregrinibacteria bacterium]|nr:glycosyltransferase family 4 protein [Candidatus Peregrinibacteria bacterium]